MAGETRAVATARTGTRHHTLLAAARHHLGVDGCTTEEVHRAIDDGLAYGTRLPRHISRRGCREVDRR